MVPKPQMPQVIPHPLVHRINIPVIIAHKHADCRQFIRMHGLQKSPVQREQFIEIHNFVILILLTDIVIHGNILTRFISICPVARFHCHKARLKVHFLIQFPQHCRLVSSRRIHRLKKDI